MKTIRSIAFLAWLVLLPSLSRSATVTFSMAQLTGSSNNRQITISLASDPLAVVTNIVFNTPLKLQPVGGMVTTNLLPANYWVQIDTVNKAMFMPVPDSTNTYNAIDLITDGLKHMLNVTNFTGLPNLPYITSISETSSIAVMTGRFPFEIPYQITGSNFLEALAQFSNWAAHAGGGTNGGVDIRPLDNTFTGQNTFNGLATMGSRLDTLGTNRFFGPTWALSYLYAQGTYAGVDSFSGIGGETLWFSDNPGSGANRYGLIYMPHALNMPMYFYAGSNINNVVSGSPATAVPFAIWNGVAYGIFAGDAGPLTNANASTLLSSGTIPPARLPPSTNFLSWYSFSVTNPIYGDVFFVDPTNHASGSIHTNGTYMVETNGVFYSRGTNWLWASNEAVLGAFDATNAASQGIIWDGTNLLVTVGTNGFYLDGSGMTFSNSATRLTVKNGGVQFTNPLSGASFNFPTNQPSDGQTIIAVGNTGVTKWGTASGSSNFLLRQGGGYVLRQGGGKIIL